MVVVKVEVIRRSSYYGCGGGVSCCGACRGGGGGNSGGCGSGGGGNKWGCDGRMLLDYRVHAALCSPRG